MGRSVGDALDLFARPRHMLGGNKVDNEPFATVRISMQGAFFPS